MDHRKKVLDLLAPNFSCSSDKLTPDQFYKKLGTAKFALSPRGGGHNCYRTWEILALGSIPVLDYHPCPRRALHGFANGAGQGLEDGDARVLEQRMVPHHVGKEFKKNQQFKGILALLD